MPWWSSFGAGDYLFFTDWRGDPDEKMRDDGPFRSITRSTTRTDGPIALD
jgi:hypothetical protein